MEMLSFSERFQQSLTFEVNEFGHLLSAILFGRVFSDGVSNMVQAYFTVTVAN